MSSCKICNKTIINPVRLWDGREYCHLCLAEFSPELCEYARAHEALSVQLKNFRSNYFQCLRPKAKRAIVSAIIIWAFICSSVFLANRSLFLEPAFWILIIIFFIFLPLFFRYAMYFTIGSYDSFARNLFYDPYTYYRFHYYHRHVTCSISEGGVLLDFSPFRCFSFYNSENNNSQYLVPLDKVRLVEGEISLDALLSSRTFWDLYCGTKPYTKKQVLLLDFSRSHLGRKVQSERYTPLVQKWLKSPFLVCCDHMEEMEKIWKDFFALQE